VREENRRENDDFRENLRCSEGSQRETAARVLGVTTAAWFRFLHVSTLLKIPKSSSKRWLWERTRRQVRC